MTAITMLGNARRACSGPTRRETLKAGALSLLGGLLPAPALAASENLATQYHQPARAKSVVLLYLQGGPPTQDMFDMKPHAPNGVGGEFRPIATAVPGIDVCELLPQTSRWMHTSAVVRSVYHNGGCHKNLPMYTGFDENLPDEEFRDSDPPSMGSVCTYLQRDQPRELPTYAYLPCPLGWGEVRKKAGPHGGFLGQRYDPFCTQCSAYVDHPPDEIWKPQVVRGEPRLTDMDLIDGITLDRLHGRRRLVEQFDDQFRQLDAHRNLGNFPREQQLAFDMLTSARIRKAFDLSREDDRTRERYGRTLFGSTTLLARRLVERGVQFVNVSWDNFSKRFDVSKAAWDTHERNFPMLRETLLPNFDQTYSAFLADLDARGLLADTLVVTMGEMGRTPKINANGGRDHWTYCYSVLFAGAGISGGTIYGASDEQAAFIKDKPVHIRDVCATIYHLLGIDPEMPVMNRAGRPIPVAHGGQPIEGIFKLRAETRVSSGAQRQPKIAIVTGSTQGLGEAIARQLVTAEQIDGLVICGRSAENGRRLANEFTERGRRTEFVTADLSRVDDCRRVVDAAHTTFGRVDYLVNSAATSERGTIVDSTPELFDRIIALNVRAPFFLMQGALRLMKEQGIQGSIVNIISMSSHGGQPFLSPYSTSKGALVTLTKNVAQSVLKDRIRVNGLNLGWMDTPGEDAIQKRAHNAPADWLERAAAAQPFGRLVKPDEVARVVAFLLSERSGLMTGAIIDFDQNVMGTYLLSGPTRINAATAPQGIV